METDELDVLEHALHDALEKMKRLVAVYSTEIRACGMSSRRTRLRSLRGRGIS
jgi:hypothetical protein